MLRCVFSIVILFLSCNKLKQKADNNTEEKNELVVILVDNFMKDEYISVFEDVNSLTFENKHHVTTKKKDTIYFHANDYDKIYIASRFSTREPIYVKQNDTIRIVLKDSVLSMHSNNPKHDFIKDFKKKLNSNKQLEAIASQYYVIDSTKALKLQPSIYEKRNPVYRYKVNKEKFLTDSIGLLTLFDRSRLDYLRKISVVQKLYEKKELDSALYLFLKNEIKNDWFTFILLNFKLTKSDIFKSAINKSLFVNDNYLSKNRYKYFILITYIHTIVLNDKVERSRSKIFIDYNHAYKVLPDFLEGELLKEARKICVNKALEQNSKMSRVQQIYADFRANYNDTIFEKYIETKYLAHLKETRDGSLSAEFDLLNSKKSRIDFSEILLQNKGKLIYIDFWASWCMPCIKAIKKSSKLHSKYINKDVVFLYISIDHNVQEWEKISENLKTIKGENSFLDLNYPNANFYKKLDIKTIPRYVLIDKNGQIVHQNAPGPLGHDIETLLDKYINK